MAKTRLGFDIGSSSIKVAVRQGGSFRVEEVRLPENMLDGSGNIALPHAFAQFLQQLKKELSLPRGKAALVLLAEKFMGREDMGGGDIKLLFALALYLNWIRMLMALLAGCLAGLVLAALMGKKRSAAVPFGPFLAVGALAAVCFGDPLLQWYFSLF